MKKLLHTSLLLCIAATCRAQTPVLVHDIAHGKQDAFRLSAPTLVWNGKLYFAACDTNALTGHNNELWSYDETGPPTRVYDVTPGYKDGIALGYDLGNICSFKGKIYMSGGNLNTTGFELLAYDGVHPPAVVADIEPESGGARPESITATQINLFFSAYSASASGPELYKYNGISAPVVIPIGTNSFGSAPRFLKLFKGNIYFNATPYTNTHDTLLSVDDNGSWRFAKGAAGIFDISDKVVVGNYMYFSAHTATSGTELYSYDGDTAIQLTHLAPGKKDGVYFTARVGAPAYYNGAIYFGGSTDSINFQLYKYNVATSTTSLAYTVNPGGNARIANLFVHNNELYFSAFTPATGFELWKYKDSTGICTLVADLYPGSGSGIGSYLGTINDTQIDCAFTEYNGHLYFHGKDSTHGVELWRIGNLTPSGVEKAGWDGQVSVYPNPAQASAHISITIQQPTQLAVACTDINGKEVYHSKVTDLGAGKHELTVPMQQWAPGQYIYRLSNSGGETLATGSIIKQ